MHDVSASAPAPPRSSDNASVRKPNCEAASICAINRLRSQTSSRSALSATGLISRVTKSRTVSRISNCSALS